MDHGALLAFVARCQCLSENGDRSEQVTADQTLNEFMKILEFCQCSLKSQAFSIGPQQFRRYSEYSDT